MTSWEFYLEFSILFCILSSICSLWWRLELSYSNFAQNFALISRFLLIFLQSLRLSLVFHSLFLLSQVFSLSSSPQKPKNSNQAPLKPAIPLVTLITKFSANLQSFKTHFNKNNFITKKHKSKIIPFIPHNYTNFVFQKS